MESERDNAYGLEWRDPSDLDMLITNPGVIYAITSALSEFLADAIKADVLPTDINLLNMKQRKALGVFLFIHYLLSLFLFGQLHEIII